MKNYEGNPLTGRIIIRGSIDNLSPKLVEAMNQVAYSGASVSNGMLDSSKLTRWEVTKEMFVPATNILHSYGYTPAIRP